MAIEAARLAVGVDTSDVDTAERKLRGLGDSVGRTGGFFRDAGATAAGFLGAQFVQSVGAGAAAMFSLGTSTQEMLNTFQAVSGIDASGLEQVQQLARELGNDLTLPATSARDATEAMLEMNKAGLSVADTMAAAKGSLQLAAAAETDAATAGEIVANSLNMFGLAGGEAIRVADLLAASANASSGDIGDMAFALRMSGTVAAQAGIPIETLVAMIGELANKGLMGSDAGTSLKTMIMSLTPKTQGAADAMEALGVAVYDAQGNMRPIGEIIGQFSAGLSKLNDEQRATALSTIFGSDAIRAASIIFGEGSAGLDAMTAAVTKQGAAQQIAAAKMKGVGGAIAGLKSQVETVLIDAFNAAAPALERAVRILSEELPRGIDAVKRSAQAVIGFLRPIVEWAVEFTRNNPGPVLAGIGAVVATLVVPPFIAWAAATIAATLPILALVAAIAGLVGGVVYAYQHFETFRETVDAVAGGVRDVIGGLVGWWEEHWAAISEAVDHAMNVISDVVGAGLKIVQALWDAFGEHVLAAIKLTWDTISGIVESAMQVIRGIIDTVLALINGDWGEAWNGIKEILGGIWKGIETLVSTSIGAVKNTLSVAWDAIVTTIGGLGGRIATAARGIWDGIFDAFRSVVNRIIGLWNTFVSHLGIHIHVNPPGPGEINFDWDAGDAFHITPLAAGGILTGPTFLGGEAGPEAVVPLSRAAEFGLGPGGGQTIIVNVDARSSYIDQRFAEVLERHLLDMSRRASLSTRGIRV